MLLATTVSCAPPAEDGEDDVASEPEVPLDLTVDHVDVAHGSMRLRATMADGSPDVAVVLGEGCDGREVGRGMATRVSLVWAFDENDVADALRCQLVVRAHAWTDQGRVIETSTLELTPDVTLVAAAVPDDAVAGGGAPRAELVALAGDPTALNLTFRSLTPRATLGVGDARIERTSLETEAAEGPDEDDTTATFAVPYAVFARALLDDRPLRIDGTAFEPSLNVGVAALERSSPDDTVPSTEEVNGAEEVEGTEEVNGTEEVEGTETVEANAIGPSEVTDLTDSTDSTEETQRARPTPDAPR
jgi:hypothetical protein